jgi:hypothetical protein
MTDKMVLQVKVDSQIALEANNDTMNSIIGSMKKASKEVHEMVIGFNKNLNATYKKSKTILDGRAKGYHTAMAHLFKVDGWRQGVFWFVLWGSIATPIVLVIIMFLN